MIRSDVAKLNDQVTGRQFEHFIVGYSTIKYDIYIYIQQISKTISLILIIMHRSDTTKVNDQVTWRQIEHFLKEIKCCSHGLGNSKSFRKKFQKTSNSKKIKEFSKKKK